MKQKLFNFLTLWVTLSVLFFIINYATNIIDVVTLGGLFAGSFIVGFIIYSGLAVRNKVVKGPVLTTKDGINITHVLEAWLTMAAFCHESVLMTTRALPGWTYEMTIPSILFVLVALPCISIYIDEIISKEG
ncbi:MAG: hypothetical protein MJ055_03065 [Phascolarctobacterium sp.]|nr:hypothetical protein [Phascolarctobacterium sp.]